VKGLPLSGQLSWYWKWDKYSIWFRETFEQFKLYIS
jgi:hypothetical protein